MKKFKPFKDHIPTYPLNATETVATFIAQQEKLLQLLPQAQTVDLNCIRIPISVANWIKLKLGDVFQFIVAHDERHLQRAKRNLKTPV